MRKLLIALPLLTAPLGAQSLVARYQLNETSGTTCVDSSGNGLDGTYRNGFSLGQPAPSAACGTSVDFDSATLSDVVIQGAAPLQNLVSDLTVSAWVYTEDLPAPTEARRVFGNNNGGWMCGIHGDGLIFTTRFVQDYLSPSIGLTAQTWTHIAFVFDSNFDVTFYADGVNAGTVTGSASANAPNPEWFIGGFDGNIEFFNGQIDDVQVYEGALDAAQIAGLFNNPCSSLGGSPIGTNYCGPAQPNSTGSPASISAQGSAVPAANNVTLLATGLPQNQFGFFLNSTTQSFNPFPGGSQGNLCLGGAIGRYNSVIFNSGSLGQGSLLLDLTQTPTPSGPVSVTPGQTWNFQCWHRDLNPSPTSNFTDAVSVSF